MCNRVEIVLQEKGETVEALYCNTQNCVAVEEASLEGKMSHNTILYRDLGRGWQLGHCIAIQ